MVEILHLDAGGDMYSTRLLKLCSMAMMTVFVSLGSKAYSDNLYRFQKQTYADDNLPPSLMQRLYEAKLSYYQETDRVISEHLFENRLKRDAKKANKTMDELRAEIFSHGKIDEKEIKKFYQDNKARIPYEYDKAKPQLLRYLQAQKSASKRDEYMARVKKEGEYELLLTKPIAPQFTVKTQGFPSKGKGKITLVEFFDYQCGHCREASLQLRQILPRFKDKVRVINIDYPINRSGVSALVAQGAYCAQHQNKYWEYHHLAFERQAELSAKSPAQLAEQLRLDSKKFSGCMASKEPQRLVARGKSEAKRLGVTGTPSFFVNGRKLIFRDLKTDLPQAINAELVAMGEKPL